MGNEWYVYALWSKKSGRFYIGMSEDPARRLSEHNAGKVKSTKAYLPWEMIHCEFVGDRVEARAMEVKMKGSTFRRQLRDWFPKP